MFSGRKWLLNNILYNNVFIIYIKTGNVFEKAQISFKKLVTVKCLIRLLLNTSCLFKEGVQCAGVSLHSGSLGLRAALSLRSALPAGRLRSSGQNWTVTGDRGTEWFLQVQSEVIIRMLRHFPDQHLLPAAFTDMKILGGARLARLRWSTAALVFSHRPVSIRERVCDLKVFLQALSLEEGRDSSGFLRTAPAGCVFHRSGWRVFIFTSFLQSPFVLFSCFLEQRPDGPWTLGGRLCFRGLRRGLRWACVAAQEACYSSWWGWRYVTELTGWQIKASQGRRPRRKQWSLSEVTQLL